MEKNSWLSGFVGGEAHFGIRIYKRKSGRAEGSRSLNCDFKIKLREDDNEVLYLLRQALGGVGNMRFLKGYDNTCPSVVYAVNDIASLWLNVVPFFDKYPMLNKKQQDFLIWRKGIERIYQVHKQDFVRSGKPKGVTKYKKEDWEFIEDIESQLFKVRKYDNLRDSEFRRLYDY